MRPCQCRAEGKVHRRRNNRVASFLSSNKPLHYKSSSSEPLSKEIKKEFKQGKGEYPKQENLLYML